MAPSFSSECCGAGFYTLAGVRASARRLELRRQGLVAARGVRILGHADVRTTLAIYTHSMRRKHDDSADKMAELAGLTQRGNIVETNGSVEVEEEELSRCSDGSPGWNRTNDQRINRPPPCSSPLSATLLE